MNYPGKIVIPFFVVLIVLASPEARFAIVVVPAILFGLLAKVMLP